MKTRKDYKNKELKLDIWKSIGETLGCTGEVAEGRWNTLRNTFTKKLREKKTRQPSGSGSKMTKIWIYFKQMSFLTLQIAHRMSRSSIADSQQEKSMTSQSIMESSLVTKDSTVKTMSSLSNNVLSSINVPTCADDSISSPSRDESLSANIATSDQQSPVTSKGCEDNVSDVNSRVQKKTASDIIVTEAIGIAIQKKKVVPAPDRFAAKKQKTAETIENVLCQSSHAFTVVATAYLQRNSTALQPQQQYLYITAIAEAMKRVPDEKQLTCFMLIMEVISTCLHDKQLPGN